MDIVSLVVDQLECDSTFRKDNGNIAAIAESIDRHGLMHPITVDQDHRVISGRRRVAAVRLLGWDVIPGRIVEIQSEAQRLQIERDENECRKDYTTSERVAIGRAIEEAIGNRQGARTDKGELRAELPEVEPGVRGRDVAAKAAGFSSVTTYRQAKKVTEKAPKQVVKAMDQGIVSINDAAKVAEKPTEVQKEAVAQVRAGKAKTLTQAILQAEKIADTTQPILDQRKQPVPERLRKVFVQAARMRQIAAEFAKGGKALIEEVKEMEAAHLVILATAEVALKNLVESIRCAIPYAVCPRCRAREIKNDRQCNDCKGQGWVHQSLWLAATDNGRIAPGGETS